MRYRANLFAAVLTLAFACSGWAAPSAAITVPEAGSHWYWFSYTSIDGSRAVTDPVSFKDKQTTAELPVVKDAPAKATLYVLDSKTGNEALIPISGKTGEKYTYTLKSGDFDHVRRVGITVTSASDGRPAAVAIVRMEAPSSPVRREMVDPGSDGTAYFTDIPIGTAKVTVVYGDARSSSQDIDIPSSRQSAVCSVTVPVVGQLETIQSPSSEGKGRGVSGRERRPSNGSQTTPRSSMSFGAAIVGLFVFAGIVYAGYVLLRNRGTAAKEVLARMGVDLPQEPESIAAPGTSAGVQVDPSVCPFCGGKKDPVTGACACSVGAGAVSPSVGKQTPRLIASGGLYAGGIYQLDSDTITIGRDESNSIAFPQDNTVSRRHSRIARTNGEFRIFDEGSSNGTYVNGAKVPEQVLTAGDEIQIGSTRLRFEV